VEGQKAKGREIPTGSESGLLETSEHFFRSINIRRRVKPRVGTKVFKHPVFALFGKQDRLPWNVRQVRHDCQEFLDAGLSLP
jgi:hypothetical protein